MNELWRNEFFTYVIRHGKTDEVTLLVLFYKVKVIRVGAFDRRI